MSSDLPRPSQTTTTALPPKTGGPVPNAQMRSARGPDIDRCTALTPVKVPVPSIPFAKRSATERKLAISLNEICAYVLSTLRAPVRPFTPRCSYGPCKNLENCRFGGKKPPFDQCHRTLQFPDRSASVTHQQNWERHKQGSDL